MENKKFSFINHTHEITRIAEELPCNFGEAFDRFRADVRAGEAHDFNTGDLLPDFDFAEAKRAWDALSDAEQSQAIKDWAELANDRKFVLGCVSSYRK